MTCQRVSLVLIKNCGPDKYPDDALIIDDILLGILKHLVLDLLDNPVKCAADLRGIPIAAGGAEPAIVPIVDNLGALLQMNKSAPPLSKI